MTSRKEYKILEERTIGQLVEDLNAHGDEGWAVIMSIQEYGVTKVVLEREKAGE